MTRLRPSPLPFPSPLSKRGGRRRFCALLILTLVGLTGGIACRREKPDDAEPPSTAVSANANAAADADPNASAASANANADPAAAAPPRRILSVVPSVTEVLFALNLGDRVVGVSDFCRWPPEAQDLPKTGGLLNPNLERMIELQPDLIILFPDHADLKKRLERFGIETLSVDHSSLDGILKSFETIGRRCGPESFRRGLKLREDYEKRIAEIKRKASILPPVSVMIAIDRVRGNGKITQVYVAGNNRYFNDILTLAGGVNLFASSSAAVPTVSREGILEKNPDVIFDLSTDGNYSRETEWTDELRQIYQADWNSLGDSVAAVKNKRVYPILTDYATIPGPRFILLVETLAAILHPESE